MPNLLDRASIVLTPTAYDDGKVLCAKPIDGSGDFDFSRNSAATRVNAQGLVEDVQILSSNLVQNGDFSNGATDWAIENTWTIGDGVASGNGANGAGAELKQNAILPVGRKFKVTYEIKNYVSGTVKAASGAANSGNGIYTDIFISARAALAFLGINFFADITNISAVEITDDTNLPRINYEGFSFDGSGDIIPDSGCGSWLWEPQSTNIITYSEDFSKWSLNSGGSLVANSVISPDGTQNASSWTTDTLSQKLEKNTSGFTQGNEYTFSIYIKADTNLNVGIGGIQSEAVSVAVTTEWQRFEVTQNASNATRFPQLRNIGDNGTFYIWGGQAEEQSYATSYIPTDGTQKTRNQDVCTNGGSAASINSTEGVLYAEISANSNDLSFRLLSLSDGTTSNRVYIGFGSVSNQLTASLTSGGSQQALLNHIVSDETQYNKVALKYKLNELSLFVNGSKVATDTTVTMPTLTSLQFTSGSTFSKFFGKTKAVAVWKEALTDTELQKLTTI